MTGAVMLGAYWSLEARLEAFFSQSKIAWCLAELSLPLWDRRRCSISLGVCLTFVDPGSRKKQEKIDERMKE